MILSAPLYSYHFVRTILSIPFCLMTFCPYTILPIPFCQYHFVRYHFVLESSEALPTQHGCCAGISRRSATDNCELRTCPRSVNVAARAGVEPMNQCATHARQGTELPATIALESLRPMNGRAGLECITDLRRRVTVATGDPLGTAHLFQRLSICTQGHNAIAVTSTFVHNTGDENHEPQ